MTYRIHAAMDQRIIRIDFSGELNRPEIELAIGELSAEISENLAYLVDLTHCALAMTASEFMAVIDVWFEAIGSATQMALVFDPVSQKDLAMLFDTKSFLVGGRQKSFGSPSAALNWLGSLPRAATR